MIPQLTPHQGHATSDGAEAVADVGSQMRVPPPMHFRPLRGTPRNVTWKQMPYRASIGNSSAKQNGLRYEAKAQMWLRSQLGPQYFAGAVLYFDDDELRRSLIPDGLHFAPDGTAYIFEVKSQHMPEAWWQLRRLYEPVVARLPFVNRVSCCEVVRSLDPGMGFPEEPLVIGSVSELLNAPTANLKVLVWRP